MEGWKAIDLANEVFGFNGWSTSIQRLDVDFCDEADDGRIRLSASCIMRITLRDGTYHEVSELAEESESYAHRTPPLQDVGCGQMEGGKNKGQAMQKVSGWRVKQAQRILRVFSCIHARSGKEGGSDGCVEA